MPRLLASVNRGCGDILGRMTVEPQPPQLATATSTWQHLDDLLDDIVGLASVQLPQGEFWRQLLDRSVRAGSGRRRGMATSP